MDFMHVQLTTQQEKKFTKRSLWFFVSLDFLISNLGFVPLTFFFHKKMTPRFTVYKQCKLERGFFDKDFFFAIFSFQTRQIY